MIAARFTAGKWTLEEDEALRLGVSTYGDGHWSMISEMVGGRSPIQCLHRWTKILKPGLKKGNWTREEDQKLRIWVETCGPQNWTQCSKTITGRNGKQCRERWHNSICPDIKKGDWKAEEDITIFNMFQKYGSKWSLFAKYLPGRSENSIKNRFYSTIRKFNHVERLNDCKKDNSEENQSQDTEICIYSDSGSNEFEGKDFEGVFNPFIISHVEDRICESVCELWGN